MATLTVRNVPYEVHRALRVRAALRGHSIEAEVRAILEEAVLTEGRVGLGSLLTAIGRRAGLTEKQSTGFAQRDPSPGAPGRSRMIPVETNGDSGAGLKTVDPWAA